METEENTDKPSNCEVDVTCDDVHCFFITVLELNWFVRFASHDKGRVVGHFLHCCFLQIVSL